MKAYLFYLAGVLLLTVPTGFFARKHCKVATLAELADHARLRLGWLHLLNFIDLGRAYLGMTLLTAGFVTYEPAASDHLITKIVLGIGALLGLALQHAFHRLDSDELTAPVAFAFGLALAILPAKIVLLALPLGIATAIAVRNLGAGLALAAFATALLGHLFRVSLPTLGTACLLLFLPALLAGLLQRRLVLTVRRGPAVREAGFREINLPASR